MLIVVTAAAIGRSCLAGNKADLESGAIGEYSIIELRIRVAMSGLEHRLTGFNHLCDGLHQRHWRVRHSEVGFVPGCTTLEILRILLLHASTHIAPQLQYNLDLHSYIM